MSPGTRSSHESGFSKSPGRLRDPWVTGNYGSGVTGNYWFPESTGTVSGSWSHTEDSGVPGVTRNMVSPSHRRDSGSRRHPEMFGIPEGTLNLSGFPESHGNMPGSRSQPELVRVPRVIRNFFGFWSRPGMFRVPWGNLNCSGFPESPSHLGSRSQLEIWVTEITRNSRYPESPGVLRVVGLNRTSGSGATKNSGSRHQPEDSGFSESPEEPGSRESPGTFPGYRSHCELFRYPGVIPNCSGILASTGTLPWSRSHL